MATQEQVVWTVLPQGYVSSGKLHFCVLVSPRLTSSASPAVVFGQWSDWPNALTKTTFKLVIDGSPTGAKITPQPGPDSKIWKAMVTGSTPVNSFKFTDLRNKTILSYPVAGLANAIEGVYATLGSTSPQLLPTKAQLAPVIGRLGARQDEKSTNNRDIFAQLANPETATSLYNDPIQAFKLLSTYHQPLNKETVDTNKYPPSDPRNKAKWRSAKKGKLPTVAQLVQSIDFHKIVASVIEHKDLSRWMGLVLDFEIDAGLVPNGSHTIGLNVDRGLNPPPDIFPATRIVKTASVFAAQPSAGNITLADRFLNLHAKGLDFVQLDVDGGGLKLQNLAASLPLMRATAYSDEDFNVEPEVRAGAPSLRTAGLMLAQARRDLTAKASFGVSGALQDAVDGNHPLPELHAEDLVSGYRVDVKDLTIGGEWHSLMQRDVDYTFLNTGDSKPKLREEGTMRMSGGSSTDGSNPDVMKIHQGIFVWRGWSLAAPEPFQSLAKDGAYVDATNAGGSAAAPVGDSQGDMPPPGLPLKTAFAAAKGTLPSLRFGRQYQVRLRAVDLAGESLPPKVGAQPPEALSEIVTYRRYESVQPPALALPAKSGTPVKTAEGESMGIAAVRTFNDVPAKNTVVNPDQAARLIGAPKVAVRFAEPHGVLDNPHSKLDAAQYSMLVKRDGTFAETPASGPPPHYAMADVGSDLPYLPDPIAGGVAIRIFGLAGVDPNHVYPVPFYGNTYNPAGSVKWPNAKTFVVAGSETITVPGFDLSTRTFNVPLKKGERAILRISCIIPPNKLEQMALAGLVMKASNNNPLMGAIIAEGQHWMLTPWTWMELVHAVQKPLILPDLAKLEINRSMAGELDAEVTFITPLSGHSTGQIDLQSQWNEPDDNPANDPAATMPAIVPHKQHVLQRQIARSDTPAGTYFVRGGVHAFPDTRYRRVNYTLDAASRYREFMPPSVTSTDGAMTITSPVARRWVRNTAPPPPPKILYVIPTFGWNRTTNGGTQVSLRAGGGLRVYLDRPWFATGFGEMLAVVLPSADATPSDVEGILKTQVTQWGRDPIWTSSGVKSIAPARNQTSFPLAQWSGAIGFDASGTTNPVPAAAVSTFQAEHADLPPGNFTVSGFAALGGKTVDVAPHAVGYDTDRQLWYCDIVVRPPDQTYYPFIRLALARYQPTSALDCYLSSVVTTEFQQLSPDRLAVVTTSGGISPTVNVSVYGYAPGDGDRFAAGAGIFRAKTQILRADGDPDLDWKDAEGTPIVSRRPLVGPVIERSQAAVRPTVRGQVIGPAQQPETVQPNRSMTYLDRKFDMASAVQKSFSMNKLAAVIGAGELAGMMAPGLLWTWQGLLPETPAGGRRRVLITECESFVTGESVPIPRHERIVYAEAIEV